MKNRKTISICLTNDIIYDRRIIRIAKSLSDRYNIHLFARKLHSDSIDLGAISINRSNCYFNKGLLFYMEFNLRLFFLLLRNKQDAIVAVDYDTILPVMLISRLKNLKMVLDAHEYFEESIEITTRPLIKSIWKWIGRTGIKRVDLAYTVSESIAEILSKKYKIPFHTIRNLPYLHHKKARDKGKGKKKIVLYQGALNRGRYLELLIDSARFLDSSYEIWILGEGDMSQALKATANQRPSKCRVIFHSWVLPSDLHEYTSQAYLAFNLLENRSKSYYYSLANKFFDYIQMGIPSLNSPFPEYQRIKETYECCLIYEAENGRKLADYILELDSQADLLASLRTNAMKAAKELCWEKESLGLMELYAKLFNG